MGNCSAVSKVGVSGGSHSNQTMGVTSNIGLSVPTISVVGTVTEPKQSGFISSGAVGVNVPTPVMNNNIQVQPSTALNMNNNVGGTVEMNVNQPTINVNIEKRAYQTGNTGLAFNNNQGTTVVTSEGARFNNYGGSLDVQGNQLQGREGGQGDMNLNIVPRNSSGEVVVEKRDSAMDVKKPITEFNAGLGIFYLIFL